MLGAGEVLLAVYLVLVALDQSFAFNLEPRLPVIYEEEPGSYFGYTVAAHKIVGTAAQDGLDGNRNPRVIVGAPKKNRRGEVMSCDIFSDIGRYYNRSHCTPLSIPEKFLNSENTTDMWLGVSVSSGHRNGILACGHRFSKPYRISGGNNPRSAQQLGLGICFKYTSFLEYEGLRLPCEGKTYSKYHQDFGLCQAGTSCHLNSEFDIQTMGAPGAKTWRGAAYSYVKRPNNEWVSEWVGTNTAANYPVDNYAYLGMSVTTGHFFGKLKPAWAAGAPRANDTGAVLLFEKNRAPNNNELELNRTLVGEQVASSFGYVIASVDINGDQLDDLIVGAPFYYENGVGGAVYVFMNEGSPRFISQNTKRQKLVGRQEESRFGFAITGMGDVDRDGFNDVAIGAPYEDSGVVYLYLGNSGGLNSEPSQIIRVSDLGSAGRLSPPTRTFGYSLSGGVDIDNNKYPDLVIGAYASDRVYTVYARPIQNIEAELVHVKPIDPTSRRCLSPVETCTTVKVCLRRQRSHDSSLSAEILQRIEAETFQDHKKKSRVIFEAAADTETPHIYKRVIQLGESRTCTELNLRLVDRSDIHNTIRLKLTLDIVDDLNDLAKNDYPHVKLIDRYPILNQTLGTLLINVNFIKNCGLNEICESALSTNTALMLPREKGEPVFYLGTETLNLTVSIENAGESAYDAFLIIDHPKEFAYYGRNLDSVKNVLDCSVVNETQMQCDLGNPMEYKEKIDLLLKFKPRPGLDSLTNVNFVVRSTTSSKDINNQPPTEFNINIVRAAELEIKGNAKPEQVWYGGQVVGASAMKSEADIGSEIIHVYSVFNYGPYLVPEFSVYLRWPLEVENLRKNGKYLLYLTDMPKVSVGKLTKACRPLTENSIDPLGFTAMDIPVVATEAPEAAASRAQPHVQQKKSTDPAPRKSMTTPTTSTTTENPFNNNEEYDDYGDYETPERSTTARTIYSRKFVHERNYTYHKSSSKSKRDVIVPAESRRVDGRTIGVVSMRCGLNTRCVEFICTVSNLKKHSSALILIKARLWNATFVEDYPQVDQVSIFSSAEIRLDPEIDIRQNATNDYAVAETKAYPDASLYQRSEGVPLWAIILAVLLGIIVFVFIVYCLYKYGFFKRNLPNNGQYQSVSQTEKSEMTQFDQFPDHRYD